MEAWALEGMKRWPNVPALYGWLHLDRRGRWRIQGQLITRPQIIETIGRNYAADVQGRWYFQNGPQRGYVSLAYAPLVLRVADQGETLLAHTGQPVAHVREAYLDEDGALLLATDLGPGLLLDTDLPWALERLRRGGNGLQEAELNEALKRVSGSETGLSLRLSTGDVAVTRLDAHLAPIALGFEREPKPEGKLH